jgi:hypothetical protein
VKEIDKFLSEVNSQIYAKFLENKIAMRSPTDANANIYRQQMNEALTSEPSSEEATQ